MQARSSYVSHRLTPRDTGITCVRVKLIGQRASAAGISSMASAPYALAVMFVAVVASLLLCSIHVDAGKVWNDPSNCGSWHNKCPCQPPKSNTKSTCVNGKCGFVCSNSKSQWRDCDNDINAANGNGCETNVDSDPVNCGGCGIICPAPANSTPRCLKGGRCSFQCNKGFKLQIDNTCVLATTNCGSSCKSPGPNTDSVCQGGKCKPVCHQGFQDCDADAAGICEANVKEDVTNCGSCNKRCPQPVMLPSALEFVQLDSYRPDIATCSNGTCGLVCGKATHANCDGDAANGCETDLFNAVSNCGSCGNACAEPPNTTGAACFSGVCGYLGCLEGFADCDGDANNGCEIDISPTVENGCSSSCPGAVLNQNPPCPDLPFTLASKCKGVNSCSYTECVPEFIDCDGEVSNGCEVNTNEPGWNFYPDRYYCGICKQNETCNDNNNEDCSSVCTVTEPFTAYCHTYPNRVPGMADDEGFCYRRT
ncbi:hypothetical protein KC19_2G199900 [Ceratodon purpureus]|uniref:Uncharacterized protein n=1 Tax=Ceratodon purpureus TaxID=3225 RepID=A0A8T0IW03_CERPU|nr:hypothetical protein KC19_2G199900 [Ceratodon purpureus]